MAKDKALSANPVHQYHKKAKQASINKSRAEKSKARDVQLQQKRPEDLQRQIESLTQVKKSGRISSQDQTILANLERDLSRINKLQAEGKLGPRIVSEKTERKASQEQNRKVKIPKDPTKSFYYDPVYNPYGVPPPGMEYKEKEVVKEEDYASDSSTTSSVARIPMPEGPPPAPRLALSAQAAASRKLDADVPAKIIEKPKVVPGRMAPAQTTYSSEPVLRDLVQESATFVPKNLKRQQPPKIEQTAPADPLAIPTIIQEEQPQPKRRRQLNIAPSVD